MPGSLGIEVGIQEVVIGVALVLALGAWALERHRQRRALRRAEDRKNSLFEHNGDAVAGVDGDGVVERVNPAFLRLTGFRAEELRGTSFVSLVGAADRPRVLAVLRGLGRGAGDCFETTLRRRDGSEVRVELSTVPITEDGEAVGAYQVARDITRRKQLERELESRALEDFLTGLPNRALFTDRLDHAMRRLSRDGRRVGLLFLDLDRFKAVNDGAGHEAGDALLQEVASRLRCFLREGDTVARLGGDEFAILLEDLTDPHEAESAAERVAELLAPPFSIDGQRVKVGASVGVAVSSVETSRPEELVRQADLAMYEAKRRGGNRPRMYSPALAAAAADWPNLGEELQRALRDEEFTVHYQPIVDLAGSHIVGAEALVRWQHPERGLVSPSGFLAFAEKTGSVVPMDLWVLRRACREARRWDEERLVEGTFFLSVNVSRRHLQEGGVVESIRTVLEAEAYPAERLQVEIPEDAAADAAATIRALRELGVRVALDDFGTGLSSLDYLKDLEVDILKVDRSFVLALGGENTSVAVLRTVLTLAQTLGFRVIAEGVEDPVQLRRLQTLGGRLVQGFYFGHAVSAEDFRRLLRQGLPPAWTWRPTARPSLHDPAEMEVGMRPAETGDVWSRLD